MDALLAVDGGKPNARALLSYLQLACLLLWLISIGFFVAV
jgi:hypothetical protein